MILIQRDDTLIVKEITEQPPYGSAAKDPVDPTKVVYYPSKERCDEIAGQYPDTSYTVQFRYIAIERDTTEQLVSNEATVTITVECIRTRPIANPDEESTDEETPIPIHPLDNDEDPENDPLKILMLVNQLLVI